MMGLTKGRQLPDLKAGALSSTLERLGFGGESSHAYRRPISITLRTRAFMPKQRPGAGIGIRHEEVHASLFQIERAYNFGYLMLCTCRGQRYHIRRRR